MKSIKPSGHLGEEIQEDSPEHLSPVKDCYSSDDEKLRDLPRRDCCEKEHITDLLAVDYKLTKTEFAKNLKPEVLMYFLDVDFNPIAKKKDNVQNETVGNEHETHNIENETVAHLQNDSVEECLFELFRFITHIYKPENEKDFQFNSKTMSEIKEIYFNREHIGWLTANDCYDWKNISHEERINKKELFTEKFNVLFTKSPSIGTACDLILRSVEIYEELLRHPNDYDECRRGEVIKSYFDTMGAIVGTRRYIRSGRCKANFPLHVPTIAVPDGSALIESRQSTIISEPDAIFTSVLPEQWKIIVDVYAPRDENVIHDNKSVSPATCSSNTVSELSCSPGGRLRPKNKSKSDDYHCHKKAQKRKAERALLDEVENSSSGGVQHYESCQNSHCLDKIAGQHANQLMPIKIPGNFDEKYRKKARNVARNSVPKSCRDDNCLNKIAGQHVIQLLSQANKNSSHLLSASDLVSIGDSRLQREIGMFVVNEYIYFSRLDIDPGLLPYITGSKYQEMEQPDVRILERRVREHFKRLRVTYSHFRLDITKATHRMALLIFITELIENNTVESKIIGPC